MSGTYEAEFRRKGARNIRYLVNTRGLQFKCAGVLHEAWLVLVLMHSSKTKMW